MDGAAECIFIWCKESESKTNNSKNIFFYIDCKIFLSSAQAHSKYIICYVINFDLLSQTHNNCVIVTFENFTHNANTQYRDLFQDTNLFFISKMFCIRYKAIVTYTICYVIRFNDAKFLYHIWPMANTIKYIGIKLEIQSIPLRLFKVSHILKPT